jgi:S1-C subfamily serine protease
MSKKVTIVFSVLVAVLVVACGVLGFWSSSLNGKIDTLNSDTLAFKSDTAAQFSTTKTSIAGVDSSLNAFKTDTNTFKADTNGKISAAQSSISGLDSNLAGFKTDTTGKFSTVNGDISGLTSDLSGLKSDTASQFNTVQSSITGINTNVAGLHTDLTSLSTQYNESTMNVRSVYDDVIGSVCYIYGPIPGGIASGSGFIYSVTGTTGYIVTCWHVVNGMSPIYVELHDGSVERATLVGSDQDSDVAVIRLTGKSGLNPVPLVDSSTLVPGEPVIVVGNPHWTFETVVYGVISRTSGFTGVTGVGVVASLIQYDAPQNTGNSGGPVFNKAGQVIGIADNSDTSGEGLHYAVSSNKVKRVAQAIIDHGSFTSAFLPGSWTVWDLTPKTAIDKGLDSCFGVYFTSITGLGQVQATDVVVAVDGVLIKETADLFSYIGEEKSVGDTITLTVVRNGTRIDLNVTLIEGWFG